MPSITVEEAKRCITEHRHDQTVGTFVPTKDKDPVKQPEHYTRYAIEPITFIMRNALRFEIGNIIKYACRAGYKLYPGKTAVESEIIDLRKVARYAEMRINQLEGKEVL